MPEIPCKKCGLAGVKPFPRGTWWRWVRCAKCNAKVTYGFGEWIADEELFQAIESDKALRWPHPAGGHSEYWYQVYFDQNADRYDYRVCVGLRPAGPDFLVERNGVRQWLEVETSWRVFIEHKHDLDKRFDGCVLAVMCPHEPMPAMRHLLPKDILYFDQDHFREWYLANEKKLRAMVDSLHGQTPSMYRLKPPGRRGPPLGESFRK